jgi:hypothetical protein
MSGPKMSWLHDLGVVQVSEYARDQLEQLKIQQHASFPILCEALEKVVISSQQ